MNLTDLVSGGIGSKAIATIANVLNIEESKAKWLVAAAVPLMVAALNYNSNKSEEQKAGINKALDQHSGAASVLSQIGALTTQGPSDDDNKIVNHIFGSNTEMVKEGLAAKTGLSSEKISGALGLLAPIVMGFLGSQKQGQSNDGGGFAGLLGGLLGGNSGTSAGAGGLMGNIIGSVLGSTGENQADNGAPSLGGLGDLAGSFFDKDKPNNGKGSILDSLAGMFVK